MNRRELVAGVTAASLAGCLGGDTGPAVNCSSSPRQDWSQYRGGTLRNYAFAGDLSTSLEVKPVATGQFDPPPVFDANRAFTVSSDTVRAQTRDTWEESWTFERTRTGAFVASPVRACHCLFVSGRQRLYALDAATGERQWQKNLDGSNAVFRSPLFAGGRLFVIDTGVSAIDPETGDRSWEWSPVGQVTGIAGEDRVFVTASGRTRDSIHGVYRLDPATGDTVWHNEEIGSVRMPPAVRNDRVGVVSKDSGDVFLLDADDGTRVAHAEQSVREPALLPTPTLTDRGFVATSNGPDVTGSVAAYDEGGRRRWQTDTGPVKHPPLVTDRTVLVVNINGQLQLLDRTSGERTHSIELPASGLAPSFTPMVVGRRVLVATGERLVEVATL